MKNGITICKLDISRMYFVSRVRCRINTIAFQLFGDERAQSPFLKYHVPETDYVYIEQETVRSSNRLR